MWFLIFRFDSLEWKLLETTTDVFGGIDISNVVAKEFMCVVEGNNIVYEIHIFKATLTETTKEFRAGFYQANGNNNYSYLFACSFGCKCGR